MSEPRIRHAPIQFRAAPEMGEGVLIGEASVYDVEYRAGYGLQECIAPLAFLDSLAERDGILPVFYAHAWSEQKSSVPQPPIGYSVTTSDSHALRVEAHLFIQDNEAARSVWRSADARALREWSVGFLPTEIREVVDDATGAMTEVIEKAELLEVSVVLKGANPATSIATVREHVEDPGPEEQEIESLLDANADREWVRDFIRSQHAE